MASKDEDYSVLKLSRTCSLCNNKFESEPLYQVHTPCYYVKYGVPRPNERRKTHEKVYRCFWGDDCHEAFGSINALRRHAVYHLTKTFKCNVCGFQGFTKRDIDRHMLVHSDKKQYKCQFCDKEFRYEQVLKEHVRRHSGQRPFSCTQSDCNRTFVTATGLKNHLKRHEKNKPQRKLEIVKSTPSLSDFTINFMEATDLVIGSKESPSNAGKYASSEDQIYKTVAKDFDEKCLSCLKSFSNQETLVAHRPCYFLNSETVDTPLTALNCDFCNLEVAKPILGFDNLVSHLATHFPKQMVHQCLHCDTNFSERCQVIEHAEYVHDIKLAPGFSLSSTKLEYFAISEDIAPYKAIAPASSAY